MLHPHSDSDREPVKGGESDTLLSCNALPISTAGAVSVDDANRDMNALQGKPLGVGIGLGLTEAERERLNRFVNVAMRSGGFVSLEDGPSEPVNWLQRGPVRRVRTAAVHS